MPERTKILLVGVGGQGVLTAAQILGDAAHHADLPVVVGQLHGMSQRGGSVECSVLIGPGRSSFLTGEADVLLGFEPLEVLRAVHRLGVGSRVLLNLGRVVPVGLTRTSGDYPPPGRILSEVRAVAPDVTPIDGPELIRRANAPRALNVVMLGALAGLDALPLGAEDLWQAVVRRCPSRFEEANRRAFELGQRALHLSAGATGVKKC